MSSGELYLVLNVLSVNIVADMSPRSAAAFSCLSEEFGSTAKSFNYLFFLKENIRISGL